MALFSYNNMVNYMDAVIKLLTFDFFILPKIRFHDWYSMLQTASSSLRQEDLITYAK